MPNQNGELSTWVGTSLDGFTVRLATEVYRTDEDGKKAVTIGYFLGGNVAKAWAQSQTDANYVQSCEVLIITNGQTHYLFQGQDITLHSDEEAALEVREKALAKLSPEERAVLGL